MPKSELLVAVCQTDTHTDKQTYTHINTMTRPGLGAGPSKKGLRYMPTVMERGLAGSVVL